MAYSHLRRSFEAPLFSTSSSTITIYLLERLSAAVNDHIVTAAPFSITKNVGLVSFDSVTRVLFLAQLFKLQLSQYVRRGEKEMGMSIAREKPKVRFY